MIFRRFGMIVIKQAIPPDVKVTNLGRFEESSFSQGKTIKLVAAIVNRMICPRNFDLFSSLFTRDFMPNRLQSEF